MPQSREDACGASQVRSHQEEQRIRNIILLFALNGFILLTSRYKTYVSIVLPFLNLLITMPIYGLQFLFEILID